MSAEEVSSLDKAIAGDWSELGSAELDFTLLREATFQWRDREREELKQYKH